MEVYHLSRSSIKEASDISPAFIKTLTNVNQTNVWICVEGFSETYDILERMLVLYQNHNKEYKKELEKLSRFYQKLYDEVIGKSIEKASSTMVSLLHELDYWLRRNHATEAEYIRTQVLAYDSLLFSAYVSDVLKQIGIYNKWEDGRRLFEAEGSFGTQRLKIKESEDRLIKHKSTHIKSMIITQCGIGTSSLAHHAMVAPHHGGAEACSALIAYTFDADTLTYYKPEGAYLDGSPKYFRDLQPISHMLHQQAKYLSSLQPIFISPHIFSPLEQKNVNIYIRSYHDPEQECTLIGTVPHADKLTCAYVRTDLYRIILSQEVAEYITTSIDQAEVLHIFRKYEVECIASQHIHDVSEYYVAIPSVYLDKLVASLEKMYSAAFESDIQMLTTLNAPDVVPESLLETKCVYFSQFQNERKQWFFKDSNVK